METNYLKIAGDAWRALTAKKDGPSLYDVCDPLLLNGHGGDAHLCKFYRTALGNAPLRSLLRGAGLPELSDPSRMAALQNAISRARDDAEPDWEAVGKPVAELLDTIALAHPKPAPALANGALPPLARSRAPSALRPRICSARTGKTASSRPTPPSI